MPVVLVSNDANADDRFNWQDITGIQYHYPNGYKNIIQPSERFIYYRGMRRANGGRGPAEYFGCGTIGEVRRDDDIPDTAPKREWAWYCTILDYLPFNPPIPAKVNGEFFEKIPQNIWRNGVRELDEATYHQIITAAGLQAEPPTQPAPTAPLRMPRLEDVTIPTATGDNLLVPATAPIGAHEGTSGRRGSGRRQSRHSKIIGDRAEEIALAWAKRMFPSARGIRWVADEGETPGWDIEVIGEDGDTLALEVKGASGSAFPTSNSLRANWQPVSSWEADIGCCLLRIASESLHACK